MKPAKRIQKAIWSALALMVIIPAGPPAAQADVARLENLCQKAESRLKGSDLPLNERDQTLKVLKSRCTLARIATPLQNQPTAKLCNDLTYEVSKRWKLPETGRSLLLSQIEEECKTSSK